MWFHVEGDPGASFWDNGRSYSDLTVIGITLAEVPVCNTLARIPFLIQIQMEKQEKMEKRMGVVS